MVGADVDELRDLAGYFRQKAGELQNIEGNLAWRIHSAPWRGADVSRFKEAWDRSYRGILQGAAGDLRQSSSVLIAQADQQQSASEAGFSGGAPSVGSLRSQEASRIDRTDASGHDLWSIYDDVTASLWYSVPALLIGAGSLFADLSVAALSANQARTLKGLGAAEAFALKSSTALSRLDRVGRGLGIIGTGLSLVSLAGDIHDDHPVGAVLDGLGVAVGVAGILAAAGVISVGAGPLIVGGIAIGAASLVYTAFGPDIESFAKRAAGAVDTGVRAAVEWTAGAVSSMTNHSKKAVSVAARGVADVAARTTGVVSGAMAAGSKFVEGIFKKPSWARW